MGGKGKRLQISAVQVVAGAGAAATAAFVSSVSGVAGTVIGAAFFSAAFTVLFAIYEHSIRRARARIADTTRPTQLIPVVAPVTVSAGDSAVPTDEELAAQTDDADPTGAQGSESETESDVETTMEMDAASIDALGLEGHDGYHWRRIALVALAIFGAAMVFVTTFELVTGRPLASLFGRDMSGTTIVRIFKPQPHPTITRIITPTPSGTSSTSPSPTGTPTPTSTPTSTPTPTPTPTPTKTPTQTPTPTSTGTASPTPTSSPPH